MLNQLSADGGERERLQRMFEQAPGFMALLEGPDHRFTVANRAFHDLVGGRDLVGRAVANAIPEFAGQGFIEIDTQPRLVARVERTVRERIGVGKHRIRLRRMPHIFLQPEVGYRQVEVQRRRHAHG